MNRWQSVQKFALAGLLMLFMVGGAAAENNMIANPGVEGTMPFFWTHGNTGGDLIWASDESNDGSKSLKIVKTATGEEASWMTWNQANTYWNGMSNTLYTITFYAKTSGVNTAPSNDDSKIGLVWYFKDANGDDIVNPVYTWVDQSGADVDWTEYTNEVALDEAPAEAYAVAMMGSDATGTVWFDQFNIGSDPWTAGFFGADVETSSGWMHWSDGDNGFAEVVEMEDAHSGNKVVKLEELDDGGDEMVFYSTPAPAEPNTMYLVGVYVKTEGMNTNEMYWPTDAMGQNIGDRANLCFFFHRGDIKTSWDLTGGDQFVYFDQTVEASEGWVLYRALVESPEDASGISMRARFNSATMGTTYYDDFFCYEVEPGDNLLANGDLETNTPAFWNMGEEGGDLTWANDEAHNGDMSLKIDKSSTGTMASWYTDNQANTYWNGMTNTLYTITYWAKTSGVNTAPASDDDKVGLVWYFKDDAGDNIVDPVYTFVDQSSADVDWTEYTNEVALDEAPAEAYAVAMMGSGATGTVWFDQFNIGSDPWTAGFFGDDVEPSAGWLHWADGDNGYADVEDVGDEAHSGSHVVKLIEADDGGDEMVYYSTPTALDANFWYEFSVWVKQVGMSPLNENYLPTGPIGAGIGERANLCFFFHRGDIETSWDLTGGDQFIYFQQVEADSGWTKYSGVVKAPEDATGASLRARFNSAVQGETWYDDFVIRRMAVQEVSVNVEEPIVSGSEALPTTIVLNQNYPNPFNSMTNINFALPQSGRVSLVVFDLLGREVARLVDTNMTAGQHNVVFRSSDLSTGVYFYRLSTENGAVVRKMMYLK
ncbi:T9SS type A sorting domain-containing protein [bacterium]|nr:T9SS type A sorting domain-containing protein [bacterium]